MCCGCQPHEFFSIWENLVTRVHIFLEIKNDKKNIMIKEGLDQVKSRLSNIKQNTKVSNIKIKQYQGTVISN